jgi:hypothetical protein
MGSGGFSTFSLPDFFILHMHYTGRYLVTPEDIYRVKTPPAAVETFGG